MLFSVVLSKYSNQSKGNMPNRKTQGDIGETEVVKLIQCPNCHKKLQKLPRNYPLYDVQCTGCSFRAQVKTSQSKPKGIIRGAGWDVIEKVMKVGITIPPLIVNFRWIKSGKKGQQILFFPFIPKSNLRRYQLSSNHRQPNYKMFNYTGLMRLPHFTLLQDENKE
jgi:hypothetical protein